jgi:muconolactone D-isomerase
VLFAVRMDVKLPADMPAEAREDLLAREREYSQRMQRSGVWPHLWRIAGEYANLSVLDVESNQHLHDVLSHLPLFPYMDIDVTPLAQHPNALEG